MARLYTIATAALTLEIPLKWLDNTLSHVRVAGVQQEKQGVARRITVDGLIVLKIAILLINELGMRLVSAIEVARALAADGGHHTSSSGLTVSLDLDSVRANLLERLENAVEIAPVPKRGRPPKNKTGRLE
jgi:hypothetical protein